MTKRIALVTGMPGSGKSEFVDLAREMEVRVVSMGDVVRAHAREKGIAPENVGEFADSERKRHGYHIWAERTIPLVTGDRVLIDGTRGMDEVQRFREEYGDRLKVIAIHSSRDHRFQRLRERKRADDPEMTDEFDLRDKREMDWGISDVIAMADIIISNEGSLVKLRKDAKKVLKMYFGT